MTKQTRVTEIVKVFLDSLPADHWQVKGPLPSGTRQNRIWRVSIFTKSGSRPREMKIEWFTTRALAKSYLDANPVGRVLVEEHPQYSEAYEIRELQNIIDAGRYTEYFIPDYDDPSLVLEVLEDAKVITVYNFTSKVVLDLLGEERVKNIKSSFGHNWRYAAELEYCARSFSRNSAEFVAALCQYHREITCNSFTQGYLQRDLEILMEDVDGRIHRSKQERKKGGEISGSKRTEMKMKRMDSLLQEMEKARKSTPVLCALKPLDLAYRVLKDAELESPELWAEGKGQVDTYIEDMLKPEFGLNARYFALFPPAS